VFELESGGRITLLAPYPFMDRLNAESRLWMAALELTEPVLSYLERFGSPIRYNYVTRAWPESMYQTVFATEPGSAEMPSAARPFTPELVTRLVSSGVQIAPLLLHTGVASLEDHEPPFEEYFRVPPYTADRVNAARRAGHRVVAVGTTVVRALETVTDSRGTTCSGEGWTGLVIGPDRPLRAVHGIITGFHEARATHLAMIRQVIAAAGGDRSSSHLDRAYREAQEAGYLWHEFGDSHLIIG
jgi:S-adenosylmethionine:tRNA ribosyltransferase-isomerase